MWGKVAQKKHRKTAQKSILQVEEWHEILFWSPTLKIKSFMCFLFWDPYVFILPTNSVSHTVNN